MPSRIEVTIGPDGKVHADFRGFLGDDCHAEEARFRALLAAFGVDLAVATAQPKTAEEIAAETSAAEEEAGARARVRRSG